LTATGSTIQAETKQTNNKYLPIDFQYANMKGEGLGDLVTCSDLR